MAANGISKLSTKELKQKAKLAIAEAKRQGLTVAKDGSITGNLDSTKSYYRPLHYLDITELPTQYNGNGITDNPNAGGLIQGRPWRATPLYSAGLYRSQYTGWPNQNNANPTWFDGKTAASSAVATDFELTLTSAQTSLGYQWLGYFLPDYTGTWTISTGGQNIDDTITVWIGTSAVSGYTTVNSVVNASVSAGSGTVSLTSGTYYPIRVQYANNSGPGLSTLYFAHTGQTTTKTWTGKLFYNPATNGF